MAAAEKVTYAFIPPPPLPEFYLNKESGDDAGSSSSSILDIKTKRVDIRSAADSLDGACDGHSKTATMPLAPTAPLMTIPPQYANGNDVPPLAIYHICRLCLRTRSARYHREHPIPIDSLPPPPGICRRCRVTSVKDTKRFAEVVTESESNKIKLGCIAPFVRDEDIISNEEMRRKKFEGYVRNSSTERVALRRSTPRRKDIVYRHVRVIDGPEDDAPTRRTKVTFTSQDERETSDEEDPEPPPQAPKKATTSRQVEPTENAPSTSAKTLKSTALRNIDSTKASMSTQASHSTSKSSSTSTAKASQQMTEVTRPRYTASDIRNVAREEVERYASANLSQAQREAEIRRFSREEIERYRQAERKLESHPDPFAHGRLVPMERRIEIAQDQSEPMPWIKPTQKKSEIEKAPAPASKREKFDSTPQFARPEDKSCKSSTRVERKASPSDAYSDYTWLRERSIERHGTSSSSSRSEAVRDVKEKRKKTSSTKTPDSEPSASLTPRETFNTSQQPDPARRSSRTESYIEKTARKPKYMLQVTEETGVPVRRPTSPDREPPEPRNLQQSATLAHGERERELSNTYPDSVRKKKASDDLDICRENDTWTKSSKRGGSGRWYAESIVHTTDTRSSRPYETSGSGGTAQTGQNTYSQRDEESARLSSRDGESERRADRTPQRATTPEASKKDRSRANSAPRSKSQQESHNVYANLPYRKIVRPTDTVSDFSVDQKPPRRRPSRDNDTGYLYAERIVQPEHRPIRSRPFDDYPRAQRVVVEEAFTETRRKPVREQRRQRSPEHRPDEKASSQRVSRSERDRRYMGEENRHSEQKNDDPRSASRKEKDITSSATSRPSSGNSPCEQPLNDGYSKTQGSDRDDHSSSRVRFSSKVHVSPTPPGSDESSAAFGDFYSIGPRGGRQLDGSRSPERSTDLLDQDGRRSRARSREEHKGYDRHQERRTVRERERRHEKPINLPQGDGERKFDGAGGRPLRRALSESPSREGLSSDFQASKVDGRGPYREEPKATGSMRVEDGSREKRESAQRGESSRNSGKNAQWW